jgi:hypothetical protein
MTSYFSAVDFGFRPIRPEEEEEQQCFESAMDCGPSPPPPSSFAWNEPRVASSSFSPASGSDADLLTSDSETLPDASGFGARARGEHAAQAAEAAAAAATAGSSAPGPFRGSTLEELCAQYGRVLSENLQNPKNPVSNHQIFTLLNPCS